MLSALASLLLASLLVPWGAGLFSAQTFSPDLAGRGGSGIPRKVDSSSYGIATTASSVAVVDAASGAVLVGEGDRRPVPIASLTKLMTASVFLDRNPGWDTAIVVGEGDWREGGFRYLWPGEEVLVRDLFDLAMVASANEAAMALVRSTGLTEAEFVAAMNAEAAELGMATARFFDPTGLDPRNVASARDVALLVQHAAARPEVASATRLAAIDRTVQSNGRALRAESTNALLDGYLNRDGYAILAAKTGFLDEAGYCLALQVRRDGEAPLTVVLLGAASKLDRWQEAKGLIDWTYANYAWPGAPAEPGEPVL